MLKLRIVGGALVGESFETAGPCVTIGRAEDNDLVVADDSVSRHHCRIGQDASGVYVEDLGSSNGTYVNGEVVAFARVVEGDEIKVGGHRMNFSVIGEAGAEEDLVIVPNGRDLSDSAVQVLSLKAGPELIGTYDASAQPTDRLVRDLGALYRVCNSVNDIRDLDTLLENILDCAFEAVEATHAFLVLLEEGGRLSVKARRFGDCYDRRLSISKAVADMVIEKGQGVIVNDALRDERFSPSDSMIAHHLRSVLCAPLACKDKVLGFIYLDNPIVTGAFSTEDLRLVSAVAIEAAVAIENSRLFKAVEDLMFGSIGALVAAVEAKDKYIRGHSERVARISRSICNEISPSRDLAKTVHLSALLHDIGKIGISEAILHKNSALTDEERRAVQEHAQRGAAILANIRDMAEVARAVRHHHEFWNGGGYPDGIAGEDVPVASRIITVADAYDAMTSDRPYRERMAQDACLNEIIRCSGTQFDPSAVEALLKVTRKRRGHFAGRESS